MAHVYLPCSGRGLAMRRVFVHFADRAASRDAPSSPPVPSRTDHGARQTCWGPPNRDARGPDLVGMLQTAHGRSACPRTHRGSRRAPAQRRSPGNAATVSTVWRTCTSMSNGLAELEPTGGGFLSRDFDGCVSSCRLDCSPAFRIASDARSHRKERAGDARLSAVRAKRSPGVRVAVGVRWASGRLDTIRLDRRCASGEA